MFNRMRSKKERMLGERLESEAVESRPEFSESLHQRIMCVAKQRRAAATAVSRRWPGVAAILAAACLFAAAIGWQLMQNASREGPGQSGPQNVDVAITDLPSINDLADHTVGRLDDLSMSVALEPQATHLKRDASAVASVFLDRLPFGSKMMEEER
jgi:hypothetical protein